MEKHSLKTRDYFLMFSVIFVILDMMSGSIGATSKLFVPIFLILWLSYFIKDRNKEMFKGNKKKPIGIGGWLILPTFAFILFGIGAAEAVFSRWTQIVGAELSPGLLFTLSCIAITIILVVITLIYEFKYRKEFAKLAIVTIIIICIWNAYAFVLENNFIVFFIGIIYFIWIPYFIYSKRIKNTFTK